MIEALPKLWPATTVQAAIVSGLVAIRCRHWGWMAIFRLERR
jgi:hypothetical protein